MLQEFQPEGLFPSKRLGFTQVVTAAAWVGAQALFHPDFLIEIEAMAVVPDRR